jgi:hypothetical protein
MDKDIKQFLEIHAPYRSKYSAQYQGTDWVTRTSFLGDFLIGKALHGEMTLGYYQSSSTKVLGIDIDDHSGKGKGYLQKKYDEVISRMGGLPPSLVNKSPRGLHVYYYLEYSTVSAPLKYS